MSEHTNTFLRNYNYWSQGRRGPQTSGSLAGLVQAPSLYDPLRDPGLARQRRAEVLERRVSVGDLTPARARAYTAAPLEVFR